MASNVNPAARNFDFLVLGSGIAGLTCALECARAGRVVLVTKDRLPESSSRYAQGGIASVWSPEDSFEAHITETHHSAKKDAPSGTAKARPFRIDSAGRAWGPGVYDGLGPKGNRAHSQEEFIELPTLIERTKMIALFLDRWAAEWRRRYLQPGTS